MPTWTSSRSGARFPARAISYCRTRRRSRSARSTLRTNAVRLEGAVRPPVPRGFDESPRTLHDLPAQHAPGSRRNSESDLRRGRERADSRMATSARNWPTPARFSIAVFSRRSATTRESNSTIRAAAAKNTCPIRNCFPRAATRPVPLRTSSPRTPTGFGIDTVSTSDDQIAFPGLSHARMARPRPSLFFVRHGRCEDPGLLRLCLGALRRQTRNVPGWPIPSRLRSIHARACL